MPLYVHLSTRGLARLERRDSTFVIAEGVLRLGSELANLTFEAFDAHFHVSEASLETSESRSHFLAYVSKTGARFRTQLLDFPHLARDRVEKAE